MSDPRDQAFGKKNINRKQNNTNKKENRRSVFTHSDSKFIPCMTQLKKNKRQNKLESHQELLSQHYLISKTTKSIMCLHFLYV